MKTDELITLLGADNDTARAESTRMRMRGLLLVIGVVVTVAVTFVGYYGVRLDAESPGIFAAILRKEVITLAAAIAGLAMAVALSRPLANHARWWMVPLLLLAGLVIWEIAASGVAGWQARLMGRNALACVSFIPLISVLPLAAILFALRNRAPAAPARAGAAAGLAAAGIGATIYAVHCTDDSMFFVAVWYSVASVVLMSAGALAGQRLLRW